MVKSCSNPRQNPNSAECVQIASNAAAPDASEKFDRVLYRTDGVTQISIVSPTISGVDSGRLGCDELLSLCDNFVIP